MTRTVAGVRARPRRIRGMTGDAGPVSSPGARRPPGAGRPPGPAWPAGFLPGRVRWTAAAAFGAVVILGFALGRTYSHPNSLVAAAIAAAVAIGAGVLLVRSWQPLLAYVAVATAGIAVVGDGRSYNVVWFAVCLLAGWTALIGGRRDGLVYLASVVALFAAEWLWIRPDPGWAAWMAGCGLTVLCALLIRHQIDLVGQLREAQAGLAARTRAEERNRVARELHDVIGHTLVVSLLHVQSARLAVEHDPADAARALAEAERLGQECLAEIRLTVGMLREDDRGEGSDEVMAPLPGVDGLPALVERFRSAGADVTLTVEGDTSSLPGTTGLAVYRIAQEALTNAVKHAPGAPTVVRLAVGAGRVTLTADSQCEPGTGTGLGVVSMRERAQSLGGTCEAGPGGHGWLVRATLPLDASLRVAP
jgi:signal transduction histidine kinase